VYTVLIVDKSTVTQRTVSAQLRRYGFSAITAETTSLARLQLAARPVDLVILGLGVLDVDGITLLHEIRHNGSYEGLPVIVLTASGHDSDRVTARAAGATAFLTKPVSTVELITTISAALGMAAYPVHINGPAGATQLHMGGSA
jgi:DNA-binding response OmpR family regulator